jgi:hypothetical protein
MLARFARMAMVATLVAMTGAHWAFLQSFAWTTMLADNLSRGSVSQAVSRTFDGKHPCPLCKAIAAGKKSERKKDSILQLQKFEFPPATVNLSLAWPPQCDAPAAALTSVKLYSRRPPVPPPRGCIG